MYRISLRVTVAALFLAGSCVLAGPGDGGKNPAPDEVTPEFGPIGQATLTANSECVVASELMGTWELDWQLSKRILGKDPFFKAQELRFEESRNASNRMLANLVMWYKGMLARDADGDNDLLFIGAPANDGSFVAYKRKIEVNEEE